MKLKSRMGGNGSLILLDSSLSTLLSQPVSIACAVGQARLRKQER